MRVKFYYIDTDKEQSPSFKAVNYKGELYPVDLSEDELNNEKIEVFIRGIGWKKFSSKKLIDIPRFSLDTKDWKSYIEKYGHRIMFYSLTNVEYGSWDCCHYHMHKEFNSVVSIGLDNIERYVEWLNMVLKLQELQLPYLEDYKNNVSFPFSFVKENTFLPHYTFSVKGFPGSVQCDPTLDPLTDESILNSIYWRLGVYARGEEEDIFIRSEEVEKQMKDDKEWPVSIQDKMIKMFGKEVADLYEKCLTFDLSPDTTEKKSA